MPERVWRDTVVRDALNRWEFGLLSRRVREIVPLRQDDLAQLTGLSQGFLSALESGRKELTHIDRILDFLTGLQVPADLMRLPNRVVVGTASPPPQLHSPGLEVSDVTQPWTAGRMVTALQDAVLASVFSRVGILGGAIG